MVNVRRNFTIEAMNDVDEGARELSVSTETVTAGGVLATVRDSGPGLDPRTADRIFEAFYTTKSDGMGMAHGRFPPDTIESDVTLEHRQHALAQP